MIPHSIPTEVHAELGHSFQLLSSPHGQETLVSRVEHAQWLLGHDRMRHTTPCAS